MKKETVEKVAKYVGVYLYGFTHAHVILVQELKKNKQKKEREKAMKNLPLLAKYCDELIKEGRMTITQKAALLYMVAKQD